MMPTMNSSTPLLKISPATTSDAMPIRIVSSQPIGSTPGWKSLPSAPTIAPTMMSHIQCMGRRFPGRRGGNNSLRGGLELSFLRFELFVGQDAGVVEVTQLPKVRLDVALHLRLLRPAHHVLHLLPPLLETLDADASLGELERLGPVDRPLLDEATVRNDERDGPEEREQADGLGLLPPDRDRQRPARNRACEADCNRQPD